MRKRLPIAAAAAVVLLGLGVPGSPASANSARLAAIRTRIAQVRELGYIQTPAYLRAKAAIDAAAAQSRPAPGPDVTAGPHDPVATQGFQGPFDTLVSPSDSQGAVGPTRFVNLVNEQYTIFDRTTPVPVQLSSGPLSSFTNVSADQFGLFDVQVIWDAGTQRFYYAMDDIICGSFSCTGENYDIAYGFSKTDSPNGPTDWCHYQTDFGVYGTSADFPDYPKLGDTKDFILIGINGYPHLQTFLSSDIAWVSKPPAGAISTCPAQNTLKEGVVQNVQNADGTTAFTPVPANQIDDSSTGYVVANADLGDPGDPGSGATGPASSQTMTVFKVTKNPDGTAHIPQKGRSFKVPTYSMPPSAPQMGTPDTLDTLDGRLTNAQTAINPATGKTRLYTQHTVAGGAGAEVRWYAINPRSLKSRMTKVTSPSLFAFNGAVSTDRANTGTSATFGDSVVVGFDTSSAASLATVQMVSKVGAAPQSGFVSVHASDQADQDFTCSPTCRWGDYAAATPDPAASPTGAHGVVWLTSMFSTGGDPILHGGYWRVWNWVANP